VAKLCPDGPRWQGPFYHSKHDSIEGHFAIVLAAPAVSRSINYQADWSIRKFVKRARRYRTFQIQADDCVITAADPIPDDLRAARTKINNARSRVH
jgi:hypothetical protein